MKTAGAAETGEQVFTFPKAGPQPVVIKAKTLDEALKKLEEITKSQVTTQPQENV